MSRAISLKELLQGAPQAARTVKALVGNELKTMLSKSSKKKKK